VEKRGSERAWALTYTCSFDRFRISSWG